MTREEAMLLLHDMKDTYDEIHENTNYEIGYEQMTALDMAIEALQAEYEDYEHATLVDIKEPLKVSVVRCKDCKHQDHCHEIVAHTRHHDDFIEHWSETIEWCSRGERKEP